MNANDEKTAQPEVKSIALLAKMEEIKKLFDEFKKSLKGIDDHAHESGWLSWDQWAMLETLEESISS